MKRRAAKRCPIRLSCPYLNSSPPPGGRFGCAGTGGEWRWPWMFIHDADGNVWLEWIIGRWLSVWVLVSPDAYSLFSAGVSAKEAFDRRLDGRRRGW